MGYFATGYGAITLSKWDQDIEKAFEGFNTRYFANENDGYVIEISLDDKYYDDEWHELKKKITPFTVMGEIGFSGDGDVIWRFIYDPKKKEWIEENASVVYLEPENVSLIKKALGYYSVGNPGDAALIEDTLRRINEIC